LPTVHEYVRLESMFSIASSLRLSHRFQSAQLNLTQSAGLTQ